jgi:hypothetical protein
VGHFYLHDGYYTQKCLGYIGGVATVIIDQSGALFSVAKDNANTINIYYEGAELKIQNKRAVTVLITFGFNGML